MGNLLNFVKERAASVISKKVGAALGAETIVAAANPSLQGYPLMLYIIIQGILDAFKYWVDSNK